jgi:hypothetical protein
MNEQLIKYASAYERCKEFKEEMKMAYTGEVSRDKLLYQRKGLAVASEYYRNPSKKNPIHPVEESSLPCQYSSKRNDFQIVIQGPNGRCRGFGASISEDYGGVNSY